jgi:hypothetical protein
MKNLCIARTAFNQNPELNGTPGTAPAPLRFSVQRIPAAGLPDITDHLWRLEELVALTDSNEVENLKIAA